LEQLCNWTVAVVKLFDLLYIMPAYPPPHDPYLEIERVLVIFGTISVLKEKRKEDLQAILLAYHGCRQLCKGRQYSGTSKGIGI
jgi:hypothetical protein